MPRKKRTTKSASKRQGPSKDASTSKLPPGSLLTSDSPQPDESTVSRATVSRATVSKTTQEAKANKSTKGTRRQNHDNVDEHASAMTSAQWTVLRKKIMADWCKDQGHQPLEDTRESNGVLTKDDFKCDGDGPFGPAEKDGALYRWGWATATNESCPLAVQWLSRLATGATCSKKRFRAIDASLTAAEFQERMAGAAGGSGEWHAAMEATIWAAALPRLLDHLEENEWWSLLGSLQNFREAALTHSSSDPMSLIAVAELGLTLSIVLRALPSCRRLRSSSLTAFMEWCEQDDLSVSATLLHPQRVRFVLASLIRCRQIASLSNGGKQLLKSSKVLAVELGTWIAGMTRSGGCQSFSVASKSHVRDDFGSSGLLLTVANLEKDSLLPAMKAAIGIEKSKGRLAWQVHLPESMLHDEDSKLACLLPEWDERRARLVVSYIGADVRVEIIAGKSAVVSGIMETHVAVDGTTLEGADQWILTCEYTDDDVHYLELEQPLDNGFLLQRQLMLIREDAGSNAAETRWQCAPCAGEQRDSTLHNWALSKNKKGTLGTRTVNWNGETAAFHMVSEAGERQQPAETSL